MGLLTTPPSQPNINSKNKSISSSLHFQSSSSSSSSIVFENSMSQEYNHHHHHHHHGHGRGGGGGGGNSNNNNEEEEEAIFAFPNGFVDRSTEDDPSTTTDDPSSVAGLNPVVYESAGMLSEMFNFGGSNPGVANPSVGGAPHEWYGDHQQQHHQQQQQHHHHMEGGGINAHNSAAAMQLFLTNAPPRSPSPPPPPPPQQLLQPPPQPSIDAYHSIGNNNNPNFWGHHHNIVSNNNPGELGGIIEGQGLSLSLSSSLQHLEAAKHAEGNQIMFFNHHHHQQDSNSGVVARNAASSSSPTHFFKNLTSSSNVPGPGPQAHLGGYAGPSTSGIGYGPGPGPVSGSSMGVVNVLRNSKYAKPAQELLEEFCSVGRGQLNKPKLGRQNSATTTSGGGGGVAGSSSSVSKEPPQLSPADRIEHQRRKVKLLAMLDEVDRRYNHYCEQMQMVVNSFDLVMGYGGAIPYTALAQKAMSRHFRCLKDAVHAQLKHSCELLGEKDPTASSGLTKGETPRLKMLEQSLRQQRAFHQMGMMDQEAWRPQRGLPERSVNILRAWLFEHFLHPYPSDADKHLLARQTGLSRNQVSNWFINARVRLWKPMVEEMYQQEAKDRLDHHDLDHDHDLNPDDNDDEVKSENTTNNSTFPTTQQQQQQQQPSAIAQNPIANDTVDPTPPDSDTSRQLQFNQQPQSLVRHAHVSGLPSTSVVAHQGFHPEEFPDDDDGVGPATMIRFGSAAAPGDVSLTLGLRHAGNAPDKNSAFSVRDFEGC